MLFNFITAMLAKKDEKGATATEYALLVGLIAVVLFTAVGLFGNALVAFFGRLTAAVSSW